LRLVLDVPRPAAEVWREISDLPRFLCIDPFHVRVVLYGPAPAAGVRMGLEHRAFGVALWRRGRLLRWEEGRGYAFSDLSLRGPERGFPHVFFLRIEEAEEGSASRVAIDVRGKWTATWLPVTLGQWWLRYVMREHARLLRMAL
jgi:hypothetical protein